MIFVHIVDHSGLTRGKILTLRSSTTVKLAVRVMYSDETCFEMILLIIVQAIYRLPMYYQAPFNLKCLH